MGKGIFDPNEESGNKIPLKKPKGRPSSRTGYNKHLYDNISRRINYNRNMLDGLNREYDFTQDYIGSKKYEESKNKYLFETPHPIYTHKFQTLPSTVDKNRISAEDAKKLVKTYGPVHYDSVL